MFRTKRLIAAAVAGSFLWAGIAAAQSVPSTKPIVGLSTVTTYAVDGRITAIDPSTRLVTLTQSNGTTVKRKVSDTVQNLGVVKVGDNVLVGYEEKLSFVLSGPNAKTPSDRQTSVAVSAAGPKAEAGVAASQTVASWWVVGTDTGAGTISLVDPNGGEVRTFRVVTPEGRAQLPRVKSGDYLTAVESVILVVAISPKK